MNEPEVQSVCFKIPAALTVGASATPTAVLLPGSFEAGAGAWLGGGMIRQIAMQGDTSRLMRLEVYDARFADGKPYWSDGRSRFEVDLTAAAPMTLAGARGSFERYASTIANLPGAVSPFRADNLVARYDVPANTTFQADDIAVRCNNGMIVAVVVFGGVTAAETAVTIGYTIHMLGRWRKKLADNRLHQYTS